MRIQIKTEIRSNNVSGLISPPCWRASSLLFPHWDIKTKRPEPVKLDLPLFWCPNAGIIMSLPSSMAILYHVIVSCKRPIDNLWQRKWPDFGVRAEYVPVPSCNNKRPSRTLCNLQEGGGAVHKRQPTKLGFSRESPLLNTTTWLWTISWHLNIVYRFGKAAPFTMQTNELSIFNSR